MRKIKNVYIYFDGSLVGSFLGFLDAIKQLHFWLNSVMNPEIFNPITFVIK